MKIDDWPFWTRAVFWNLCAVAGVYIGFASSEATLPVNFRVYIAVYAIAFFNLMVLSVPPLIVAQKKAGRAGPNPFAVAFRVLMQHPYVSALVVFQLAGTSRTTATAFAIAQASTSDYVRGLQDAESVTRRLVWSTALMAAVAVLWLLGVIGLWLRRSWGWWLALALNGLAAGTAAVLQFTTTFLHLGNGGGFLLDLPATATVVLLLLPSARRHFRRNLGAATPAQG